MNFTVPSDFDGQILKAYLRTVPGLSGSFLRRLKFTGGIMLNGEVVTVRALLHTGDTVTLLTEDAENGSVVPSPLPLPVVYEDSDVVVPEKPAGMPTHPSHGHYDDTVANALCARYQSLGIPFVFRPVQRLDRNTSGLLLIARSRTASDLLNRQMSERKIKKKYLLLTDGVPPEENGTIEGYIRRTDRSIIVRETCDENGGGDYALTNYRVLLTDEKKTHALVLCEPLTGRTHQIRVHMTSIGCPLCGDDLYGDPERPFTIGRHALHAAYLSFCLPSTGERTVLTSPLPDDMRQLAASFFPGADVDRAVRTALAFPTEGSSL